MDPVRDYGEGQQDSLEEKPEDDEKEEESTQETASESVTTDDLEYEGHPEGAAWDQEHSSDRIGEGRDRPPLDSIPPLDDFIEPEPKPDRKPRAHARPPKKKEGNDVLAWMLFLLFIGGLGTGFWYGRKAIVTLYPKAMALYEMFDLPVFPVGEGLNLLDMETARGRSDGGNDLIVVRGEIHNVTQERVIIPKIQASLQNDQGVVLTRRSLQVRPNYLDPREETAFEIKLMAAKGATNVVTIFIGDDQAMKEPDFEPLTLN